jgi:D-tyrosyl-tRNA(Tyr) deacylase
MNAAPSGADGAASVFARRRSGGLRAAPSAGRLSLVKGLVQRVRRASVAVDGEIIGEIGAGSCVFVGVGREDGEEDALLLADRLVGLRIFADDAGKMNRSLADVGGAMLVVSQFTLFADTRRGRRPSFVDAAPPERADTLIEKLAACVRERGIAVAAGRFGADMLVEIHNDGPVTLMLDTRERRSG